MPTSPGPWEGNKSLIITSGKCKEEGERGRERGREEIQKPNYTARSVIQPTTNYPSWSYSSEEKPTFDFEVCAGKNLLKVLEQPFHIGQGLVFLYVTRLD